MSRLILAALIAFSVTPAFAGTARTAMRVGVMVVYGPPPPVAPPAPAQPAPVQTVPGH